MPFRSSHLLPNAFVGILSLSLPVLPLIAKAQSELNQTSRISIPAGSLEQALNSLGQQTGVVLIYASDITAGLTSPGLTGDYTVQQALSELTRSTGIHYRIENNTIILKNTADPDNNVTVLDPVKVKGTRSTLPHGGNTTSVTVSLEGLSRIKPTDLKGVFINESAVSVGGSMPLNQKLYLRGVEETALSVSIDGARQNNKVFHHNATTLIDPTLLKSVRASAGIAPADDGPGAIGGSVVYETVDAADYLDQNDPFAGFINLGYDSNGKTFTTGASVFARNEGFEWLAFANKAKGDDYKDGNGDTVDYSAADLLSGLTKLAYETERGDRFELSFERVKDDAARPYRANFGSLTAGRPVPESRNYDLERTNIVFNYNHQKNTGLWNPLLVIASSQSDLTTKEAPLAAPNTTLSYNGITSSDSLKAENLFITDFARITAGVDYYRDTAVLKFIATPDIEEKVDNKGAYVQVRQTLLDRLQLSYGLRYDQQDFTGTDDTDLDNDGVSTNVFAEYQVNDHLSINAGYAAVHGGIALAENFILNPAWDYSADINPVKAENWITGFKSQFGSFRFGGNYYETAIANGRTPSYRGSPSQTADFDIRGYDLFTHYDGELYSVILKYSDIKADKDGAPANSYDGNYFTAPLGRLIALNGTVSLPNYKVLLGSTIEASLDNEPVKSVDAKQEAYTVVGVYADFKVLENLDLRFAINNLTDQDYVDRASYGQEFATVKPLLEKGRTYVVTTRYSF